MSADTSFLSLVLGASIPVQLVMLILLVASLASWAIIFRKRKMIRVAVETAEDFENNFWSGGDLSAMFRRITGEGGAAHGMEGIFESGFREFGRLRNQGGLDTEQIIEGARRAMRVSQMRETDRLEHNLATLATVGSTSPYVGLFGTVWGIMNAFQDIAHMESATIALVAPGISEALVATAMGLFAAIPAVIAYNRYADQVSRLEVRYDTFMEEFSSILQRHAPPRARQA